ncbi:MAG: sensor histidine kinase [Cellulosilyticum sp.]|nr:sensor histidine kinase [Cellulosilyticum sp.]
MERKTELELALAWGKKRMGIIAFVLFLVIDYMVIMLLMHLELAAFMYSTIVGGFVGIWLMIFDFIGFRKKYYSLLNTYHNKEYNLDALPEVKELIEQSYTSIIHALDNDLSDLRTQIKLHEEEADDYYTLWTHQIKTPIAAMKLILQNLQYDDQKQQEARASKQVQSYLALQGELFRIEQYADMALQYLRLESMSKDIILKEHRLYDIVANALKKYSVYFMRKNLQLEIEEFDTKVITDEKWLQFVIEQILSNSVKYTPQGKIIISTKNIMSDESAMQEAPVLVIQDTGIGIHSEDVPRIFDRGFTGYNGRMDKKSTGIGLYLCKKVTSKLSHTLTIHSEIGEGTTVQIGFPMNKKAIALEDE